MSQVNSIDTGKVKSVSKFYYPAPFINTLYIGQNGIRVSQEEREKQEQRPIICIVDYACQAR